MAKSKEVASQFKTAISAKFQMRDMGSLSHFLGMTITRDRQSRTISLVSSGHIKDVRERFGMAEGRPTCIPFPSKVCDCTER